MPAVLETPKLKELSGKLDEKRKALHEIFEAAGPEMDLSKVESIEGDSAAKVEKIRALNDEIDDLAKSYEEMEGLVKLSISNEQAMAAKERHPGHPQSKGSEAPVNRKSIGELFIESKAGHERKGEAVEIPDIEVKTLFETGAGWAPETIRTGRLVEEQVRPIQVIDLIPSGSTSQSAVVYMEETTFTNNAAEAAEGAQYGEAALALTEVSEPVRKIGVFLPITDEQLEDVPQARGYVNNRLPFMLRQRLDSQIVVGDGTAPNISGFLDRSGLQTQALGADPKPDAVYKAMVKVRVTGRAIPGAALFHPNDWQDIRLLRTADGIYIWGSPSEAGPARIWGIPVVETDAITENTALVGDFANFSELAMRRGIEVKVSDSHSDFFIKGKQAIRADVRAALCVYRPAAFCQVTGL